MAEPGQDVRREPLVRRKGFDIAFDHDEGSGAEAAAKQRCQSVIAVAQEEATIQGPKYPRGKSAPRPISGDRPRRGAALAHQLIVQFVHAPFELSMWISA